MTRESLDTLTSRRPAAAILTLFWPRVIVTDTPGARCQTGRVKAASCVPASSEGHHGLGEEQTTEGRPKPRGQWRPFPSKQRHALRSRSGRRDVQNQPFCWGRAGQPGPDALGGCKKQKERCPS